MDSLLKDVLDGIDKENVSPDTKRKSNHGDDKKVTKKKVKVEVSEPEEKSEEEAPKNNKGWQWSPSQDFSQGKRPFRPYQRYGGSSFRGGGGGYNGGGYNGYRNFRSGGFRNYNSNYRSFGGAGGGGGGGGFQRPFRSYGQRSFGGYGGGGGGYRNF